MNQEFDYTLKEIFAMKWQKFDGFDRGRRRHWLGDFDGDSHIAYNNVQIVECVKSIYNNREVTYEVTINADMFGEKGYFKILQNTNLRAVKAHVKSVIESAYENSSWVLKKRNME